MTVLDQADHIEGRGVGCEPTIGRLGRAGDDVLRLHTWSGGRFAVTDPSPIVGSECDPVPVPVGGRGIHP
jgi:hypothetical protein